MKTRIFNTLFIALVLTVFGISFAAIAQADEVVTNLNDTGAGSLRQAIIDVNDGGTITFQTGLTGTINLTSTPDATTSHFKILKSFTIDGPDALDITVRSNGSVRAFWIEPAYTINIYDLKFENGYSDSASYGGGAIYNKANLTLENCIFSNNSALNDGGGLYNRSTGVLVVTSCTFSSNSPDENGGGIYNDSGVVTVISSTFSGNTAATSGGGIYNNGGTLTVENNCIFTGNEATSAVTGYGGGIYSTGGTLDVSDTTFSTNTARSGGGIYSTGDTLTVAGCTFDDNTSSINTADYGGGGMEIRGSNPDVVGCIFKNNNAARGAGVHNFQSSPSLTNCTFQNNISSQYGGGIYNRNSGGSTVINCTFTGNQAQSDANRGGGIYNSTGTSSTEYNTIFWNNTNGDVCNGGGDIAVDASNLTGTDPQFKTGTLELDAGSPAIDAGNNSRVPGGITTDLNEDNRFVDDPATADTGSGTAPIVDIGAYEYQVASAPGTLAFTTDTYANNEGNSGSPDAVIAIVQRTGGSDGAVTVQVTRTGGTATASADYTDSFPITVSFADGDTADKTVTLPIVGDTALESDETIDLQLGSVTGGASLGTQATATYTITNDDAAVPGTLAFTTDTYANNEGNSGSPDAVIAIVQRTGGSDGAVSVQVTRTGGDAATPGDYTDSFPITVSFADGDTADKDVLLPIVGDTAFETDETIDLQLGSVTGGASLGAQTTATYTITNDDAAVPGTLAFTTGTYSNSEGNSGSPDAVIAIVQRTGGSDGAVSVQVTRTGGDAAAPADYTDNFPITVSFADGDTADKTVTLPIVGDTALESDETIDLQLGSVTGGASLGTQATATYTITNDDAAVPGTLAFTTAAYANNEGNSGSPDAVIATVQRTGGSDGAVTVQMTRTGGTATASADYTDTFPITVSFADGDTADKTVTLPIVGDTALESDETIDLQLGSVTGGASLGAQTTATYTITNDDAAVPGTLAFTAATYSSNEGNSGSPDAVIATVQRTGGSDGAVTVQVTRTGGTATAPADYTDNFSITVSFADGDTADKTVTLPIVGDTALESDETIDLQLGSVTGGASLGTQTIATYTITNDDETLEFTTGTYSSSEGNSGSPNVVIASVQRTGSSDGAVTVQVNRSGGTATAPGDYTDNFPITVSFADGDMADKDVEIPIVGDTVGESDETIILQLNSPTGGASLGTQTTATYTITNDDPVPGTLAFTLATYSGNEGNSGTPDVAIATVSRTGGSDGIVTVQVQRTGGSATAPTDYTDSFPITLTFADGDAADKDVEIPIVGDTVGEPNETISMQLSSPTGGASLGTQTTATHTITNDDTFPGVLEFTTSAYNNNEGNSGTSNAIIAIVSRSGGSDGAISVQVQRTGGAATAPADYTDSFPITINFADGDAASKNVEIPIVGDTTGEPNETIAFELVSPTGGASLGAQAAATYTITNDDSFPGVLEFTASAYSNNEGNSGTPNAIIATVSRTGGSDGVVSVQIQRTGGTAATPADYANSFPVTVTFADGDAVSKDVELPIVGDTAFESGETIELQLASPTGGASLGTQTTATYTITNDDPAAPGTLQFTAATYSNNEGDTGTPNAIIATVQRTGGSDGTVTVQVQRTGGTATTPDDYTNSFPVTITFTNGDAANKNVEIPIVGDTIGESDETIILQLSGPTGGASLGAQTTATYTITNEDPFRGSLAFTVATYSNNEEDSGTPNAVIATVSRTGGSDGAVSVQVQRTGGTATAGADYTNNFPITVTFSDGDAANKDVELPIVGDTIGEPNETIELQLSGLTGGASLGTQTTATYTITNEDPFPGTLEFTSSSYSNDEGDSGTSNFVIATVRRTGGSDGLVTVEVQRTGGTAAAPADYTDSFPVTITFADGNTTDKNVEIPIVGDTDGEPDETINLQLNNSTGGASVGTQNTATYTIVTDDILPQTITFDPISNRTYGDSAFTVNPTATSGLYVTLTSLTPSVATVSGHKIKIVGIGTATIQASQGGNGSWYPAPNVNRSFKVSKADQTISFGTLGNKTYGDASFTVNASATSGLPVSFTSLDTSVATVSGNTVTIVGGGTVTIRASQGGDGIYNAAPNVDRSFTVNKANQTLTFDPIQHVANMGDTISLTAIATSGLTVSFSSTDTAIATVSGNTATIRGAGTVFICASQGGNTNYNKAEEICQSLEANSSPVITEGDSVSVTMDEDGIPTKFDLTLHAADADSDGIRWSVSEVASHGTASVSSTKAQSKKIHYNPPADWSGTDNFEIQVADEWGGTDSIAVRVIVRSVNDAPVLDPGEAPALDTIEEDPDDNPGNTVAEIVVDGSVTEPADGSPKEAIAVTSVDNTHGIWEYNTGAGWQPFSEDTGANVSFEMNARLLDSSHRIRFVPNPDYPYGNAEGMATLTFRAWDKSEGTPGGTWDVSSNGGTSPFSEDKDHASIIVTQVDDSPVLENPIPDQAVLEDADSGKIDLKDVFTDVDNSDDLITWEVSENTMPSLVSASIDGNGFLILDYLEDQSGEANLTVLASSNGKTVSDEFRVTVYPVNDAPWIPPLNPESFPALDSIDEDTEPDTNMGNTVAEIIGDRFIDDPDTGEEETVQAIAVTGVNNILGTWQYSRDDGDTWNDFTSETGQVVVMADEARLLESDDRIRFIPNENYYGTSQFTFRAWDQTDGSTPGETADTTSAAGSSAFSAASDEAKISVEPVDNMPIVADPIDDVVVGLDAPPRAISIANVFTDVDNDPAAIVKSVQLNTNEELVSVTLYEDWLLLDFHGDSPGMAEVWILGMSNGKPVLDDFLVTVRNLPDAENQYDPTIPAFPKLTDIGEDALDNPGNTVAEIFEYGFIRDTRQRPVTAIAVTSVNNVKGQWQYTLDECFTVANDDDDEEEEEEESVICDESVTWHNFTEVIGYVVDLDENATLLDSENRIRFVPKENYFGEATFTFLAWDKSEGEAGEQADTLVKQKDSSSPFTKAADEVTIDVIPVDDPPVPANPVGDILIIRSEDGTIRLDDPADNIRLDEVAGNVVIELDEVFTDVDDGLEDISKNVGYTNPSFLEAQIEQSNSLTLDFQDDPYGVSVIVVQATSNGQNVTDTFSVRTVSDLKGDVDGNGILDLEDLVLALQVVTGTHTSHISPYADVNQDGRIGIQEAIYILTALSAEEG